MNQDCEEKDFPDGKKTELLKVFQKFHQINFSFVIPGITHSEFCTLKAIQMCGKRNREAGNDTKISDIVKHMQVPPPAVSRTMKTLEERDLIHRSVNKMDRRNTMVELTESGDQVLREAERKILEFQGRIFAKAGQEEIDQVIRILNHIYDIARSELELYKEELKNKQHSDKQ